MNTIKIFFCFISLSILVFAQPKWKSALPQSAATLPELFHSISTANFPTTETLKKGDFEYHIAHRFHPPIQSGYKTNWGLDGPANMRMALSYGIHDRMTLTLGRSNVLDNLDFQLKYQLPQSVNHHFPTVFAIRSGLAWNMDLPASRQRLHRRNFQYYFQLIQNTMLLNKQLGIGIIPSYVYNGSGFTPEVKHTFSLGNYYQYYINDMWSIWMEYNALLGGYQGTVFPGQEREYYNSMALGLDIETGGHVFHLFVTNNTLLNPSQYLIGSDSAIQLKNGRLGFGIRRVF